MKLLSFVTLICATQWMAATGVFAQIVTIDFDTTGGTGVSDGTLVLLENGSGPIDDFESDRFDGLTVASFEIQNISGFGTVTVTATALSSSLNVNTSGLQDGGSGYNSAGEGTSFVFSTDVIIESLDFSSFTVAGGDAVEIIASNVSIGTFADGDVSGSIDFSNTNPAIVTTFLPAGDAFTIAYSAGAFALEELTFTAIPEPSTYALLAGLITCFGAIRYRRWMNTSRQMRS